MEPIKYKVVIAAGVEPIPFWKYADYDPRALPTVARAKQNIDSFIRYEQMKLALGDLGAIDFKLVTQPTAVATEVTNFEFEVSFMDITSMINGTNKISTVGSMKGEWKPNTAYAKNDYVTHNRKAYRALSARPANATFDIIDGFSTSHESVNWVRVTDFTLDEIAKAGAELAAVIKARIDKAYFQNQLIVVGGVKANKYPTGSANNMDEETISVVETREVSTTAQTSTVTV